MFTTLDANRVAARGHSAGLTRALKRLGMRRCSERRVRYQYEAGALRPSWYCLFWRWVEALWLVNRPGAEFIFEDFRSRFEALRRSQASPPATDWVAQVARCARESGQAIAAAAERRDAATVRREVTESIVAQRDLLALLDLQEQHAVEKAA